jgi:hypothetical protein
VRITVAILGISSWTLLVAAQALRGRTGIEGGLGEGVAFAVLAALFFLLLVLPYIVYARGVVTPTASWVFGPLILAVHGFAVTLILTREDGQAGLGLIVAIVLGVAVASLAVGVDRFLLVRLMRRRTREGN